MSSEVNHRIENEMLRSDHKFKGSHKTNVGRNLGNLAPCIAYFQSYIRMKYSLHFGLLPPPVTEI